MLSIDQYQIIEEQLSKETAKEFVKSLLAKYADDIENISDLLSYIPKLAEKQLNIKQKQINQYSWAADMMIGDRYMHPYKYKKNESNNRFCMLLYTCKAHFKNGNAEHSSVAGKTFFDEFIEMLKNKTEFNYENDEDWEWIYSTAGCADWLESVIRQNIDSGFVKPDNNKYRIRNKFW